MDALSAPHKTTLATVLSVFQSGDIAPLTTALADNFVYKQAAVSLTKDQFISHWKEIFAAGARQRVEIISATESGNIVKITLKIFGGSESDINNLLVESGETTFTFEGSSLSTWEDHYTIPL